MLCEFVPGFDWECIGDTQIDRMSVDMAQELKSYNVACITLYPGAVLTEEVNEKLKDSSLVSSTF